MPLAVIPARYASTRFPGKPLADRTGQPLIQHVVEQVRKARLISRVIVATDDDRIADAVRAFGGDVAMTRQDHPNGTSRIAEVAAALNLPDDEIVVNVQGDEPLIEPGVVDAVVELLQRDAAAPMSTIASPFSEGEQPTDPNIVKVVVGRDGRALYFSRSVIPFDRDGTGTAKPLKHVGLYAYRRRFLARFVSMPATPLEDAEKLEQLRALEHGYTIRVAIAPVAHHGIDTPEQYEAFVAWWRSQQT